MVNQSVSIIRNTSRNLVLFGMACLLVIVAAIFIFVFSPISIALLPTRTSPLPLHVDAVTDKVQGGDSEMSLYQDGKLIHFDFMLSKDYEIPYTNLNLMFDDLKRDGTLVDLSMYNTATIKIRCSPRNELSFMLHVYEDNITELEKINTFRKSYSFFTCDEIWQEIPIDLQRLVTPEWWLQMRGLSLSKQQYSLKKVKGISFTNTAQTPRDAKITVYIEGISFQGRHFAWVVAGCVLLFTALIVLPAMMYANRDRTKVKLPAIKTKPLPLDTPIAHHEPLHPVDIKSKRERETESLMEYLLLNYANADISLEETADELGINRTKINDILKETTSQTFSVYLNKLRLTEAARLLTEKQITVSETAFAVGFGSISYFNRVFKKEFGCAPSQFRDQIKGKN